MNKKNGKSKVLLWLFFWPILLYVVIFKKQNWSIKKKAIIAGAYSIFIVIMMIITNFDDGTALDESQSATSVSDIVETEDSANTQADNTETNNEDISKDDISSEANKDNDTGVSVQDEQISEENTDMPVVVSGSKFEVHFLDVGQALSILVTDGNGNDMLYDAGNEGDADFIISYLKSEGVDDIEYLINSHPHEDHLGGMDKVLSEYAVETVIMSNKTYDTKAYTDVISAITSMNIAISDPIVGAQYQLGSAVIEILGPIGTAYDETNDYSVIVKVINGEQSVLLTGDAEAVVEHELVEVGTDLSADILQVGHHGSASSSTAQFLYEVNPQIAVISVGEDNSYGHPDNLVVNRLENMDVDVYRTDFNGTVVLQMDGKESINVITLTGVGNSDSSSTSTSNVTQTENNTEDDNVTVDTDTSVEETTTAPVVEIIALNKSDEYVVIKNTDTVAIDIGGWVIVSEKGNQSFVFPSGYTLETNQECKLTAKGSNGTGDFIMSNANIWHNDDYDPAVLYDSSGAEVDRFH